MDQFRKRGLGRSKHVEMPLSRVDTPTLLLSAGIFDGDRDA
jgi:hypothetical protein